MAGNAEPYLSIKRSPTEAEATLAEREGMWPGGVKSIIDSSKLLRYQLTAI